MKRIDGYLARKAQNIYPDALVYCDEGGTEEVWTLERPGQPAIGLGHSFHDATQAVAAMTRAKQATQNKQ